MRSGTADSLAVRLRRRPARTAALATVRPLVSEPPGGVARDEDPRTGRPSRGASIRAAAETGPCDGAGVRVTRSVTTAIVLVCPGERIFHTRWWMLETSRKTALTWHSGLDPRPSSTGPRG